MIIGLFLSWFTIAAIFLGVLIRLNLSRSLAPLPLRSLGFGLAAGGLAVAALGGGLVGWHGTADTLGRIALASTLGLGGLSLVTGVRAFRGARAH